mmetsp:Transcript_7805/g.13425  ORF Transcript_7805/g.13425 Transcript_7805/m.13425 type:complete len:206 (-) Transcript_7805:571-1188(-)
MSPYRRFQSRPESARRKPNLYVIDLRENAVLQPGAWKLSLHTSLCAITAFCIHAFLRRPIQTDRGTMTDPVPFLAAIPMSALVGAGAVLLIWLVKNSLKAPDLTLKPSRARICITLGLVAITPVATIEWLPISLGVWLSALFYGETSAIMNIAIIVGAFACAYPVAALIAHHTKDRRWLRIGMITLIFWSAYSGVLLWFGVPKFL